MVDVGYVIGIGHREVESRDDHGKDIRETELMDELKISVLSHNFDPRNLTNSIDFLYKKYGYRWQVRLCSTGGTGCWVR